MASDGKRLQRALSVRYGHEVGADLYGDVILRAWADWPRVSRMSNPSGYLWTVAKSGSRRYARWERTPRRLVASLRDRSDLTERDLFLSLGCLSRREQIAVVMVHADGATYQEVADYLDVPITTVTNLVHRGLSRLRRELRDPR